MTFAEEFGESYKKLPTDPAKRVAFKILDMLNDRGVDDWWGNIGEENQEEILEEMIEEIEKSN